MNELITLAKIIIASNKKSKMLERSEFEHDKIYLHKPDTVPHFWIGTYCYDQPSSMYRYNLIYTSDPNWSTDYFMSTDPCILDILGDIDSYPEYFI